MTIPNGYSDSGEWIPDPAEVSGVENQSPSLDPASPPIPSAGYRQAFEGSSSSLGSSPPEDPTQFTSNGMEIDLASQSLPSYNAPRNPSIPTAPEEFQTIAIRLVEVILRVLGTQHITSTSDEGEPMDHDLFRGVLQSLQAHSIHIPEDVGVFISTIQAHLHNGVVDNMNILAD